jgi:S1-C subfamily serine protease
VSFLAALSRDIEELVARAAPSVVAVEHHGSQGSGIVLAGDGYVVTNSHVARCKSDELYVRLPSGDRVRARRVGDDPPTDLAVLRVEAHGLPSLELADERRLRVGQLVVAIGNPLRFERSVSLGVVSAIERSLPGPQGRPFEGLVQTDAAINPGNSGGPLLDATGAVVGINTAVIPRAHGLGFAIPAHTVSWVAAVLIARGKIDRPWLGIAASGVELAPALASDIGQPRALRVHTVGEGTPAKNAGLRQGDLVLRANQNPIYGVDDLQRVMVLAGSEELRLEFLREGDRHDIVARPQPKWPNAVAA